MMDNPSLFRYRVRFSKTEAMRFTGNLDLYRTWERTLRRAGVPLAYSLGFSPHPKVNLGAALALGCSSEAELAEIWLEEDLTPPDLRSSLEKASPPGFRVTAVERIATTEPALQTLIRSAEYEVRLHAEAMPEDLTARVGALLGAPILTRERRGKAYDLRPLIEALEIVADDPGEGCLRMRLAAREGATGRPQEVLLALGMDPTLARIHRRRLMLDAGPRLSSDAT